MKTRIDRRDFLSAVGAAGALTTAGAAAEEAGPTLSDPDPSPLASTDDTEVVVGVMGLSRGQALASEFARQPGVLVRYVCDVDDRRSEPCADRLRSETGQRPTATRDFRQILEDPQVDILVCAAPNHWHATATVLACRAGKHVYVEKPCSHTPHEGELMVAAAREHRRCVQMGTQRRSSPGTRQAMRQLQAGVIGRVYLARSWYNSLRGSIGTVAPSAPPQHLDYQLWQGPAPRRPYRTNIVHYNWHWQWHWGNGELGNNGVHTLDLCRWGLQVDYPLGVTSSGGRYCFQDDQETPDTHTVGYEFPQNRAITWQGLSCNRHGDGFVTFYGEDGALDLSSDGTFTIYDRNDKPVHSGTASSGGQREHVANFLAAVRAEDPGLLNAEIEEAHKSTLLCHLGNIAHRVGRRLTCTPDRGTIVDDAEAWELWTRQYAPGWNLQA